MMSYVINKLFRFVVLPQVILYDYCSAVSNVLDVSYVARSLFR